MMIGGEVATAAVAVAVAEAEEEEEEEVGVASTTTEEEVEEEGAAVVATADTVAPAVVGGTKPSCRPCRGRTAVARGMRESVSLLEGKGWEVGSDEEEYFMPHRGPRCAKDKRESLERHCFRRVWCYFFSLTTKQ